ncbi:MAG: hypothetical protein DRI39_08250, partial [Chloroflexi bacterium]
MRVAIVSGYPLGESRSGSVTHVEKLAQHLSAIDGMEVHVITLGRKSEQLMRGRVAVHVLRGVGSVMPFLFPITLRSMKRTVEGLNPDVVHALRGFRFTAVAALLRNRYPAPITIFSVERMESRFDSNPLRVFRRLLISIPNEKYVIPRASHVIVQSRFTEGIIRRWTKAVTHLVPEGVEYDRIQRVRLPDPPDGEPDIFIAVNFRRLKGLDILIKAVAIAKETVPDIRLDIGGSGEEEDALRDLVGALGLESNVRFLGFIADEEAKYQQYKSCKLVVVPSRWDVEPAATLDGAASGKPVIASKSSNSSLV